MITEVVEACGARNVFADLDTEAAAVDREAVLSRQPDIILAGAGSADADPLAVWRDSPLVAAQDLRLERVDAERLVRPTPRILDGIDFVCALVAESEG